MFNSWFIPPIVIPILIGLGLVKYVSAGFIEFTGERSGLVERTRGAR